MRKGVGRCPSIRSTILKGLGQFCVVLPRFKSARMVGRTNSTRTSCLILEVTYTRQAKGRLCYVGALDTKESINGHSRLLRHTSDIVSFIQSTS